MKPQSLESQERAWAKYNRASRLATKNLVKCRHRRKMERRVKYWINQSVKWRLKVTPAFVTQLSLKSLALAS